LESLVSIREKQQDYNGYKNMLENIKRENEITMNNNKGYWVWDGDDEGSEDEEKG